MLQREPSHRFQTLFLMYAQVHKALNRHARGKRDGGVGGGVARDLRFRGASSEMC